MALEIKDRKRFGIIVTEALLKSKNFPRWQKAIARAAEMIDDDSAAAFMTWQPESKSLLIWSQGSNDIHSANGTCDCKAFLAHQPCWHRALARLVRLYLERQNDRQSICQRCKLEFSYPPEVTAGGIPRHCNDCYGKRSEPIAAAPEKDCGCFFNWDDKFTDLCERHQSEAAAHRREEELTYLPPTRPTTNRRKIGGVWID